MSARLCASQGLHQKILKLAGKLPLPVRALVIALWGNNGENSTRPEASKVLEGEIPAVETCCTKEFLPAPAGRTDPLIPACRLLHVAKPVGIRGQAVIDLIHFSHLKFRKNNEILNTSEP